MMQLISICDFLLVLNRAQRTSTHTTNKIFPLCRLFYSFAVAVTATAAAAVIEFHCSISITNRKKIIAENEHSNNE